jgi:hypothetical protein
LSQLSDQSPTRHPQAVALKWQNHPGNQRLGKSPINCERPIATAKVLPTLEEAFTNFLGISPEISSWEQKSSEVF